MERCLNNIIRCIINNNVRFEQKTLSCFIIGEFTSASGMSVPPNQIAKPNSPSNTQQQSILPPSSSPKPSSSSSPSQPTNTHNLVSNQQQQQQPPPQMGYNNYSGQPMYHPQQNYHMQQQWQNQPRMMMQPQYPPYQQGQYQAAPPQT